MAFQTSTPNKAQEPSTSRASISNFEDTFESATTNENNELDSLINNFNNLCNDIDDVDEPSILSEDEASEESETDEDESSILEEEETIGKKKKWDTLIHNGPLFPPPYERLPKHIKLIYDNQEIELSETAEEIATFYAKKLNEDERQEIQNKKMSKHPTFKENFFQDWRETMNEVEKNKITIFDKCDFSKICDYFKTTDELNLSLHRLKNEERYGYCLIDNRKEKISCFMVGVPGFYIFKGDYKFLGRIKKRVSPEEITINCSKGEIPSAPEGHNWKKVVHNRSVLWLAQWRDETKKRTMDIRIKRDAWKAQDAVREKYEITRKLGEVFTQIETDFKNDWKSDKLEERQRGVVIYLLYKLALRVGFSNKSRPDTAGCCSLLVKHIKLEENNQMTIECFTKNFIFYHKTVILNSKVYENMQKFTTGKKGEDKVFDKINPKKINDFLKKYNVEGLQCHHFRLYRSCKLLEQKLKELTDPNDSVEDKLTSLSIALQSIAILCNHQVTIQRKEQIIQKMEALFAKINTKLKFCTGNKTYLNAQITQLAKQIKQFNYCKKNYVFNSRTTKMNYIDPRIIVVWCLKHNVPIEEVLPNEEFKWAIKEINFVF